MCIIAGQLPDLEPEGHRSVRHVEVVCEIGYRSDSLALGVELVFGDERPSREYVRLLLVTVVGCTKSLADFEWLGEDRIIGLSGAKTAPDLYLSVGVSGQIQHTVGVSAAKLIAAVNKDKEAPIFALADYGIVVSVLQPVAAIAPGSQWDIELPRRHLDVVLSGHSNRRRRDMSVIFRVEIEREIDGRWLAEVVELPGVLAYGATDDEAIARIQALALRVVADRLENDEADRAFVEISFKAA